MKIRPAFVSNSSTTIFICDISGDAAGGEDMGLRELGMCKCENGHIFFEDYLSVDKNTLTNENINLKRIPGKYCPLCTKQYASKTELLSYALHLLNQHCYFPSNETELLETYQHDETYIPTFIRAKYAKHNQ